MYKKPFVFSRFIALNIPGALAGTSSGLLTSGEGIAMYVFPA